MRRWEPGINNRSMTLWDDDVMLATVEQNIGTNIETGEYFLLDNFTITFRRQYHINVGPEDDMLRAIDMRNYYYATLDMAVSFAEKFAKHGIPECVDLGSPDIMEFIANRNSEFINETAVV